MPEGLLLSLVICTYNRDKYLPQALESISRQQFDSSKFELLIVDNYSTDNTASISKTFIEAHPELNVRYIFEARKGLSFARNRGLMEARSPIVSYVDDDAILSPDFVREMTTFFETHPDAAGAGGRVIPKYESGAEPVWMSKYLAGFVGRVEFGDEIRPFSEKMKYPAGCNMSYRKQLLLDIGGFNNELTFRSDDKYIFFRVREANGTVYYVPGAYVHHYIDSHRMTLNNFRKLFLKTGNEEKIRIRSEDGTMGLVKKFVEYLIKFGASLVLYLVFLLKGQEPKGRYVVYSQWFTLKGFLSKKVFVR